MKGSRDKTIAPDEARALLAAAVQAGYWTWADKYRSPVTDNPSAEVSLSVHGQTKTINEYPPCSGSEDGAPQALCDLEGRIDEDAGIEDWVTCASDAGTRTRCAR